MDSHAQEYILQQRISKLLQKQRQLQIQELNGGFYRLMEFGAESKARCDEAVSDAVEFVQNPLSNSYVKSTLEAISGVASSVTDTVSRIFSPSPSSSSSDPNESGSSQRNERGNNNHSSSSHEEGGEDSVRTVSKLEMLEKQLEELKRLLMDQQQQLNGGGSGNSSSSNSSSNSSMGGDAMYSNDASSSYENVSSSTSASVPTMSEGAVASPAPFSSPPGGAASSRGMHGNRSPAPVAAAASHTAAAAAPTPSHPGRPRMTDVLAGIGSLQLKSVAPGAGGKEGGKGGRRKASLPGVGGGAGGGGLNAMLHSGLSSRFAALHARRAKTSSAAAGSGGGGGVTPAQRLLQQKASQQMAASPADSDGGSNFSPLSQQQSPMSPFVEAEALPSPAQAFTSPPGDRAAHAQKGARGGEGETEEFDPESPWGSGKKSTSATTMTAAAAAPTRAFPSAEISAIGTNEDSDVFPTSTSSSSSSSSGSHSQSRGTAAVSSGGQTGKTTMPSFSSSSSSTTKHNAPLTAPLPYASCGSHTASGSYSGSNSSSSSSSSSGYGVKKTLPTPPSTHSIPPPGSEHAISSAPPLTTPFLASIKGFSLKALKPVAPSVEEGGPGSSSASSSKSSAILSPLKQHGGNHNILSPGGASSKGVGVGMGIAEGLAKLKKTGRVLVSSVTDA